MLKSFRTFAIISEQPLAYGRITKRRRSVTLTFVSRSALDWWPLRKWVGKLLADKACNTRLVSSVDRMFFAWSIRVCTAECLCGVCWYRDSGWCGLLFCRAKHRSIHPLFLFLCVESNRTLCFHLDGKLNVKTDGVQMCVKIHPRVFSASTRLSSTYRNHHLGGWGAVWENTCGITPKDPVQFWQLKGGCLLQTGYFSWRVTAHFLICYLPGWLVC